MRVRAKETMWESAGPGAGLMGLGKARSLDEDVD